MVSRPLCRLTIAWCYHMKVRLVGLTVLHTQPNINLYPLHLLFFYHSYSDSFHCWFSLIGLKELSPSPQLPLSSVSSPALSLLALVLPLPLHGPCWCSCVVFPSQLLSPLPVSESPLSSHPGFLWEQRPDECISFPFSVNR